MFVLNIDMSVKPGSEQLFEQTYTGVFVPAISQQEGFEGVGLLRPNPPVIDYRLVIEFRNQAQQQKWVATPLHQELWPQMESFCAKYTVQTYNSI